VLRREGRGLLGSAEKSKARRIFVVTEFAFSLVLTIAAVLLLRSFWDLYKVRLGFDSRHVMSVRAWLPVPNDPQTDPYRTASQEAVLVHEVLRHVQTLPGVKKAAVGDMAALPLGHGRNDLNPFPLIREGHEVPSNQAPVVDAAIVSPEYFHLLGISPLRGRIFGEQDIEATPPVAVINEAMARAYWPNQDPVGTRVNLNPAKPQWTTVIGIVADAHTESLAEASVPQIYLCMYQRRPRIWLFFSAENWILLSFRNRCASKCNRWTRNCPSSERGLWTTCLTTHFRDGASRWRYWPGSRSRRCCLPAWEYMA